MEELNPNFIASFIAGVSTAVAAGYLGAFMVLRRMSLVSDALSHVALPGIALGILYHINPFVGAFAFLLLGVILIAVIERQSSLPTDAIVGVLFSASLALGILLTPEPELLEALFGDFTEITRPEALITAGISLLVIVLTFFISRRLMFAVVAPDLGHVSQKREIAANLLFLVMLAGIVALGIKFVGTLLMGTLTVIPAAAAKNISGSLLGFSIWSMVFGAFAVILGMGAVYFMAVSAGPAVILSAVGIFILTLVFRR